MGLALGQLNEVVPVRSPFPGVRYPLGIGANVKIEVDKRTADVLHARAAELGVPVSELIAELITTREKSFDGHVHPIFGGMSQGRVASVGVPAYGLLSSSVLGLSRGRTLVKVHLQRIQPEPRLRPAWGPYSVT